MADLHRGLASHKALGAELLARWPELRGDAEAYDDTLEGISSFPDMIAAVLRSAIEDDLMVASLAEHIDKLRERQQRLRERSERKRAEALHFCQEGRLSRVAAPDFTASITMGKGKVVITDEHALSDFWKRVRWEIDKSRISEALRDGVQIEGATLSNPEPHWTIRR